MILSPYQAITAYDNVGMLVGKAKGNSTIRNCVTGSFVENEIKSRIVGHHCLGGLVGKAEGSVVIEKCVANCNVVGIDEYSARYGGGAIGFLSENSAASESISRGNAYMINGFAGGFVGYSEGDVRDCASFGNCETFVSASISTPAGGFAGQQKGGDIKRCYSTGIVKNGDFWGGFAGGSLDGTNENCYYDTDKSSTESSPIGSGKTHAEMGFESAYEGFDFGDVWEMIEGDSYPTPKALSEYQPFIGNKREYLVRFKIHRPTNRNPENWGSDWDGELVSNQLVVINTLHRWEPIFVSEGQLNWSVESQFGSQSLAGKNTIGVSGSINITTDTVIEANAVWNDTNVAWNSLEDWLKPKFSTDDIVILDEKWIAFGFVSGNSVAIDSTAALYVNGVATGMLLDSKVFPLNPEAWTYYRTPGSGFDWVITKGDFKATGSIPNGIHVDTLIAVILKYFAFIHGESVNDDITEEPFPAPAEDKGNAIAGAELSFANKNEHGENEIPGDENMVAMHFYTRENTQPFAAPKLFRQSAPTTEIAWNDNPLPQSLVSYKPGKYTFRTVNSLMDWLIIDGDHQAKGMNQNIVDSSTEVVMKYWAMIHGDVANENPSPTPFPAPSQDRGDMPDSIKVTTGVEWEARQALVTWIVKCFEDPAVYVTGYKLFINGKEVAYTQAGFTAQLYVDFHTVNNWFILSDNRQARGSFNMVESNIDIEAAAKLDVQLAPHMEDEIVTKVASAVDFEDSFSNSIAISISNIEKGVPRHGYAIRAWKAGTGVDATTPGWNNGAIYTAQCFEGIGITLPDTADAVNGDTYVWEITKNSWYASGSVTFNANQGTKFLNVQVSEVLGEMTDSRDGKAYKTVMMPDGKLWSAQNLDYAGFGTGVYYGNDQENAKYGRMYSSNEALNNQSYTDLNPSARQGICPAGWHIPSDSEWTQLMHAVTMNDAIPDKTIYGSNSISIHALHLKSSSEWNGDDTFGFNALPGGVQEGGVFSGEGNLTEFVSCSDYNFTTQISREMSSVDNFVTRFDVRSKTTRRMYIRLIKDRVS